MTTEEKDFFYTDILDDEELNVSPRFGREIDMGSFISNNFVRRVSMKLGDNESYKIDKKIEGKNGIEILLKTTENKSQQVKAYFCEMTGGIQSLTVQRWMQKSGKAHKEYMTLETKQIELLIKFIKAFKGIPLNSKNPLKIPLKLALENEKKLTSLELEDEVVIKYLKDNPNLLKSIVENDIDEKDVISIAYRKKQLEKFKELLDDKNIKEPDWQKFFENNTWIFGYGLSYIFQTNLDDKKIEQVVSGFDFASSGKRVDGLLKTRGLINSLCFIEIKTHKTPLLKNEYRISCWNISDELSGAISQIQNTVSLATHSIYDKISLNDKNGNPTGEEVFNYQPKSFLIVGKLDEFKTEHGVNSNKLRSFELFRKNIFSPEIITFDELYERARFIVQNS